MKCFINDYINIHAKSVCIQCNLIEIRIIKIIIIIIAKRRKILQFKLTNIQDRERVSDKTGEILIKRYKIATKEITKEFDKIFKITKEITYAAAYVIPQKLIANKINYTRKRMHRQPLGVKYRAGKKHYKRKGIYC